MIVTAFWNQYLKDMVFGELLSVRYVVTKMNNELMWIDQFWIDTNQRLLSSMQTDAISISMWQSKASEFWSGTAIEANYKHIKDNRNIFSREWEGLNFFV